MRLKFYLLFFILLLSLSCNDSGEVAQTNTKQDASKQSANLDLEEKRAIAAADQYLDQPPVPITNFTAERSEGGIHDFYSEGDYWWPDPDNPEGPYIRRDGKTNPENFTEHRIAMRDLSRWVAALVAAYQITGDEKYAQHAMAHLNAFFLDPATLMNPNLLYAQAIKGRVTGRGIGLIDTIHLIEVAKAIEKLAALNYLKGEQLAGLKNWFDQFATWMNTHPYGLDEKDHGNNHSTWWAAQVAAFAHLTDREDLMEVARSQFKKLLSAQMAEDGSFPEEMDRTKPYNYTLFNLEGYSTLCEIASTAEDNLWAYKSKNGTLQKAWDFMFPFMKDKSTWPKEPDVQHFDQLPIQSPGLLFAAKAYDKPEYLSLWLKLSPERKSNEIDRTYPIRQPVLWKDE